MNRKVNIKILILIATSAIVLFFMGTKSFASETYSVGMTLTSNSKVNAGESVTMTAEVNNINAGDGIDVIIAKLNYDTNIFKTVSQSDFSSNTGWDISYAPSTNMLIASKNNKVKNTEKVFTLKLNAIQTETTTITLTNVEASGGSVKTGGTGDIYINNQSITLNKGEDKQYSARASMSSNSNLNSDETITVNFALNNIDAGNGINVISAKLNYDTSVFETISQSDFSSNTGWDISYAPSTNRLVAMKDNKITSGETIFTLTLRLKSNNSESSTITISEIEVSGGSRRNGGTGDISVDSTSITLNKANKIANVASLNTSVQTIIDENGVENTVIVDENGQVIKVADNTNKIIATNKLGKVDSNNNTLELNNTENNEESNEEVVKQNKIRNIVIGSVSVTTVLSGGLILLKKFFLI